MSTPEANFEIAVDDSRDEQERRQAIDSLEAANECDLLANLVQRDDLSAALRETALESLAHPQCKPMLAKVGEDDDLPESLADQAATLLEETPDDAGAGP